MKISIKYGLVSKEFENKTKITIGNSEQNDFCIKEIKSEKPVILLFVEKYNNYVIVNHDENQDITLNGKTFSKTFVQNDCALEYKELNIPVEISINNSKQNIKDDNLTLEEVEQQRIAIAEGIRYKVYELKRIITQTSLVAAILDIATLILSVVCSFGMTNFLLGLKIDNSTGVLNITTNYGFLICISAVIIALSAVIQHGCIIFFENGTQDKNKPNTARKTTTYFALCFFFVVYMINLLYYKNIPNFSFAAFFVSLLFSGGLVVSVIAGGYIKKQLKLYKFNLTKLECRQDFESILKIYAKQIYKFVNELSQNKINNVKETLLNNQLRMIVEVLLGILTAPFLAYGVSNTLASCFPEAASWIRVSGIRFSPIFLVLATFLIIFAFFSFVKGFAIGKQIKASDIIKYDGFQDYKHHGVTILGFDAVRNLQKEKRVAIFIACSIILIEFTMNVSYFIGEMGADMSGILISSITALVPTALLIAETHLLSSTISKINNLNELIAMLD